MLSATGITIIMTPKSFSASQEPNINLNILIPTQFSTWHQLPELDRIIITPKIQTKLKTLYQQNLSRTYINSKGDQIMLTIAYGHDQRDGIQVHKPEACYPAQGFQILEDATGFLSLTNEGKKIPVKRLVAIQGARTEPITYWITMGDTVALSTLNAKITQLKYGLTGEIPDGLLFRVSSIDQNSAHAFQLQSDFVNDLFNTLTNVDQVRLAGETVKQTPGNTITKQRL